MNEIIFICKKIDNVIQSCETLDQLDVANKFMINAFKKIGSLASKSQSMGVFFKSIYIMESIREVFDLKKEMLILKWEKS